MTLTLIRVKMQELIMNIYEAMNHLNSTVANNIKAEVQISVQQNVVL